MMVPALAPCGSGAWLSGAGSLDWYDGGNLANAGDVVVVGVNYRLGPLGFLHYPGLADGMMGLQDIVAALRFVHDHIKAFGGDPENVTLMGQSAGAGAIYRLILMEQTRGLFHRAIAQSGTLRRGLSATDATKRARRLMQLLGIDPEALVVNVVVAPTAAQMEGETAEGETDETADGESDED